MTLSLYIARQFFVTLVMICASFFAILFLIDLVEEVRRVVRGGFSMALQLALLHTPGSLYRMLPLLVLLTAIALFLRLARTSELLAIRAAGRSALRTLIAPVVSALLFGILAVAVLDPIAASTGKRYQVMKDRARGAVSTTDSSFSGDGIWLRQGDDKGQWVIHADRANPDGTALFGVSFLAFGATGGPTTRIEAADAALSGGSWIARDAKEWILDQPNPEAGATQSAEMVLATDLTADEIRDGFGTPENVGFWDLPAYIDALEKAGFSARSHAVWFQMELAQPLLLAAMVLIGAGFSMRHARFGNTGVLVLMALVSGIAVFFVRNFAQVLGESGQVPVVLAAWIPPVVALFLAVSLLLHLEDG